MGRDFISDSDLKKMEEHNQKSLEEMVNTFREVFVYLKDGRVIAVSKNNEFEFKDSKFHIYDKDIEVGMFDIEFIEIAD